MRSKHWLLFWMAERIIQSQLKIGNDRDRDQEFPFKTCLWYNYICQTKLLEQWDAVFFFPLLEETGGNHRQKLRTGSQLADSCYPPPYFLENTIPSQLTFKKSTLLILKKIQRLPISQFQKTYRILFTILFFLLHSNLISNM